MTDHISPDKIDPRQRTNEIAKILAQGFMRMFCKQAESMGGGDYSVDLVASPSIHAHNINSPRKR